MKTQLLTILTLIISFVTFGQIELLLNTDTNEGRRTIKILTDFNNELLFSVTNTSFQTSLYNYKNGVINQVTDVDGNSVLNPLLSVEKDNKLFFNARVNNVFGGFIYDGSSITNFVETYFYAPIIYKDKIYFDNAVREGFVDKFYLFSTDGTKEGTSQFKKIETLKFSGTHRYRKIVAGDYLFFTAHTDDTGVELWRTDGTEAGTIMLKDINPGSANSEVTNFFVASNGLLYFQAKDGVNGEELWVTDGTEAGTKMLNNFYDGAVGGDFYLEEMNDKVYIALEDTNENLYETDGTPANTKKINESIIGSKLLKVHNNLLYFYGNNGRNTGDFYVTDGTDAGTKAVLEGIDVDRNVNLVVYKNEVYFNGALGDDGEELWKTDGSSTGTIRIKNIGTDNLIKDSFPTNFYILNNELYFQAYQHKVTGLEWWKTDGTEAGTVLVADTNSGRNDFTASGFYEFNSQLFFIGGTGDQVTNGLYKLGEDGTASTKDQFLDEVGLTFYNKQLHIRNLASPKSTLSIYNMLGKRVLQEKFSSDGDTQVDVNLKQGIYIVNVKTHLGANVVKKIIVEN
jgi:ELWxxDGT repeat protein